MKILKEISPVYIVMLLFSGVALLYYPSLIDIFFHPSVFSIDDANLMNHILNYQLQMDEVFSPRGSGKYFRPFHELSYLIDQRLWGANVFGFRMTNLLIHLFNVVLVYLTVRLILNNNDRSEDVSALSAIIFGVHPIAVESVAWICGRTDSLATMWGLLSLLLYFSARIDNRWYLLPFSLFCAFASALSKEVGFAIPVIIVLWEIGYSRLFWPDRQRIKVVPLILAVAVIPIYLLLRSSFFTTSDVSLRFIKSGISYDFISSLLSFLASYGFYIKKFIYPFPLELVIEGININGYAFLGLIISISFLISLLIDGLRRYSFFLLWALLGIGPAALVSFTDIAWTKWAERYLYFSLVPLSVITAMVYFELTGNFSHEKKRIASIVGICVLLSLALVTFNRSRLWNDNLKFWEDAYSKNPNSINVAVPYANLLIQKNKIDEAGTVLDHAMTLKGPKHQVLFSLAHISRNREDFEKAEGYYKKTLDEARADSRFVLEGAGFKSRILLSIGELKIAASGRIEDDEQRKNLYLDGVNYFEQAYKENPDAFLLYRIAKEYMSMGEKEKAIAYFKQYRDVSGDSIYRQSAEKLIRKLE